MSHKYNVGDLVCYGFHDCEHPIRLMAIVLECYHDHTKPYYLIQFIDDGSQMTVTSHELDPVDKLLSYPDTPQ